LPEREGGFKTADISQGSGVRYRCFSDPSRPQLQDFCGSDEIGG
jgi:hypothetical protein